VFIERTSVGLDVHARSVVAAAIDGVTGELVQSRLTPSHDHIRSWLSELPGPVAVAYEAGPTGFGLARSLIAAGTRCEVVAPSKLQRPSGDRVKTDAKDAVHLARLLRLDEYTAVSVPTVDQESARDLVRAREDARGDLMRARHRLSKLLLRQGIVYCGGQAWTGAHDAWLRRQRFDVPALQMTFESDYDAVLTVRALRPLAPALLAAWLVCFVTALHEVTMSSLLYGPGGETFAVVVLNSAELGRVGLTAALSVLLTLVMLVPALPAWLLLRWLRSPRRIPGTPPVGRLAHAG